ncbi:MAG: hypothetical protein PHX04_05620 [Bacilli bacterium]|nr:hypothetical protein [Bacilli bacterium]
MRKIEEKVNPILGRADKSLDLIKFNILSEQDQYIEIEKILKEIYQTDLEVSKKHVYKCIKLTCNPKDDYTFLPYSLKVSKEKLTLKFTIEEKKTISKNWIIFSFWLFLFALAGATYAGFAYLSVASLNKDIDGDGIPDINIDINKDNIADINIDIDGDNKPDINIDYKGNRKARFNIDLDGDKKADTNLVNYVVGDACGTCTLNCDLNGDGWPDINIDIDGDGKADLDIDTDKDCSPDLNLDLNGDEICDLFCDTDGDGLCDTNCIKPTTPINPDNEDEDEDEKPIVGTGSSIKTGSSGVETSTPYIIIHYSDGETINVTGLLPEDQTLMPGYVPSEKPIKEFTVENLSDYPLMYNLTWKVDKNNFISNNLKYNLIGTNGAPNLSAQTVPKLNGEVVKGNIYIPPRVIHKYTVEIYLHGTGAPQNEDQGKVFIGNLEISV